jgi:hypothetical protein
MRLSSLSIAAAVCVACGSTAFAADPPKDAAPKPGGDAAAAQAMFYEARQLMKANKFGLACPKLEESLRLDYGIGTEFNLADCHEKVGKIASAWSGFLSVASAAHTAHQTDREKVARDRAKALEPRLPKLTIEVPPGAPAGLEVKRDGVVVGQAGWNTAVPVDPGAHDITATAPGKIAWHGNLSIAEQKTAKITVPRLEDQPVAAAPVAGATTATKTVAPPPGEATSTTTITSFPEPIVENRGQTQRTIGWIVGGVGVASLGVGAGFGINSLAQRARANDHCNSNNICDAQGVKARDSAITSGDVSTITTIAGAGALLGGIVLVLTAPKTPSREKATVTGSIHAVPQVATNGAGLSIQGILP